MSLKVFDLIYYCDGYPEIGMGHVFRGIDIVNHYSKNNPKSKLAIQGEYHSQSIDFIRSQLLPDIEILNSDEDFKSIVSVIDTMFYPGELKIDNRYFSRVKKKSSTLIFLWDVIEYTVPKEVDIIINHLPYSRINGASKCEKYIGLEYTPVPIAFYENDYYKIDVGSILSVIGSSKSPELLHPFLQYLENLQTRLDKIVIISPSYNSGTLKMFQEQYMHIAFRQNVPDLYTYIKNASAVITTYGNTTFQAMASKIPTFTVAFQNFQNVYGAKLESTRYSVNLGMFEDLQIDKLTLITNKDFKLKMHHRLKEKFVTPGINNIIGIIKAKLPNNSMNH